MTCGVAPLSAAKDVLAAISITAAQARRFIGRSRVDVNRRYIPRRRRLTNSADPLIVEAVMDGGCTASQEATPPGAHDPERAEAAHDPRSDSHPAGFTDESVALLRELAGRAHDPAWHEQNRHRYEQHLRRPLASLLRAVRDRFIRPLSLEVAACRRPLASLRKNGF